MKLILLSSYNSWWCLTQSKSSLSKETKKKNLHIKKPLGWTFSRSLFHNKLSWLKRQRPNLFTAKSFFSLSYFIYKNKKKKYTGETDYWLWPVIDDFCFTRLMPTRYVISEPEPIIICWFMQQPVHARKVCKSSRRSL